MIAVYITILETIPGITRSLVECAIHIIDHVRYIHRVYPAIAIPIAIERAVTGFDGYDAFDECRNNGGDTFTK